MDVNERDFSWSQFGRIISPIGERDGLVPAPKNEAICGTTMTCISKSLNISFAPPATAWHHKPQGNTPRFDLCIELYRILGSDLTLTVAAHQARRP